MAVLGIFALGSLVAALSHSIEMLVAGRAIQGAGGAIFPLAFGIIRDEFPAERVATGIGLISATFGIGGGAGLVLSGLIVDHLSYEWIFWFGFAVVVLAIVATPPVGARVAGEGAGAHRLRRGRAAVRRTGLPAARPERGRELGLGLAGDRRPVRGGRGDPRAVGLVRGAHLRSRWWTSGCCGSAPSGPPT